MYFFYTNPLKGSGRIPADNKRRRVGSFISANRKIVQLPNSETAQAFFLSVWYDVQRFGVLYASVVVPVGRQFRWPHV